MTLFCSVNILCSCMYMFDRAQQFDVQQNKQTKMLLDHLKKMEEEKEQLVIANKQLAEEKLQNSS